MLLQLLLRSPLLAPLVIGSGGGRSSALKTDELMMPPSRIPSQHLVFAEVHPWASTPSTGGWRRYNDTGHNPAMRDILSTMWPLGGLTSSANCSALGAMGTDLRRASVDVAVIDWIGGSIYPGEKARVEAMISCLGVPAVVMVDLEPAWTRETFPAARARLDCAVRDLSRRPGAYRDPASGLPLIFVWDPGAAGTVAEWTALLARYRADTTTDAIFVAGLGFNTPVTWFVNSTFDGASVAAQGASAGSDQKNFEWVLWQVYGVAKRDQFLIGWTIAGFDTTANCDNEQPQVTPRAAGATFDAKWGGVINSSWSSHVLHSAYVPWHNDGEDNGIAPVDPAALDRAHGFAACGGRVQAAYKTYAPLKPYAYVDRNAQWASRFRSRP